MWEHAYYLDYQNRRADHVNELWSIIDCDVAVSYTHLDVYKRQLNTHINEYLEQLKEQWEELPPYFITSSENRMGRKELLDYICLLYTSDRKSL